MFFNGEKENELLDKFLSFFFHLVANEHNPANLSVCDQAGLVAAAEEKGFELLEVRGKDPRLVSMDDLSGNEIPLHFLFRLQGYVVHVVVLYERSGNYLWHGVLRLKPNMDRKFAPFRRLDYGRNAGAYDRYVDTRSVYSLVHIVAKP